MEITIKNPIGFAIFLKVLAELVKPCIRKYSRSKGNSYTAVIDSVKCAPIIVKGITLQELDQLQKHIPFTLPF